MPSFVFVVGMLTDCYIDCRQCQVYLESWLHVLWCITGSIVMVLQIFGLLVKKILQERYQLYQVTVKKNSMWRGVEWELDLSTEEINNNNRNKILSKRAWYWCESKYSTHSSPRGVGQTQSVFRVKCLWYPKLHHIIHTFYL